MQKYVERSKKEHAFISTIISVYISFLSSETQLYIFHMILCSKPELKILKYSSSFEMRLKIEAGSPSTAINHFHCEFKHLDKQNQIYSLLIPFKGSPRFKQQCI